MSHVSLSVLWMWHIVSYQHYLCIYFNGSWYRMHKAFVLLGNQKSLKNSKELIRKLSDNTHLENNFCSIYQWLPQEGALVQIPIIHLWFEERLKLLFLKDWKSMELSDGVVCCHGFPSYENIQNILLLYHYLYHIIILYCYLHQIFV